MPRRRNQKRTRGRRGRPSVKKGVVQAPVTIIRGPNFAPPRLQTHLRYTKTVLINNAGFLYANVAFIPTYAYDIDPTVGSTAAPGFTEWAGLYRYYRVLSFKFTTHLSNNEAQAVEAYICASNAGVSANTSSYAYYTAQRISKKTLLGPLTGNSIARMSIGSSVARFAGSSNLNTEDYYSASTSGTAPPNNIYVALGIFALGNLTVGVTAVIDIDFTIQFFELTTAPN